MKDAKIDVIDLRILHSLIQDGRKSFRQISREINISTPTVETRFETLKKVGIIKSIEPKIDLEKLEHVILNILFIKTDPKESNNVALKLKPISEMASLYVAGGDYDLIAITITRDQNHFEHLWQEILKVDGINEMKFHILSKTIKDQTTIPIEKEVKVMIYCIECNNPVHSLSFKIIDEGFSEKYFCCQSCLALYNKEHKLQQ